MNTGTPNTGTGTPGTGRPDPRAPRIAVVGMACRYPDAVNPGELWQNVLGGRRAFRRFPETRLRVADYGGEGPDSTYAGQAGVLRDWEFDRGRFHISGGLYRAADHTHWLALETAADALADAGFPGGDGLDRDSVGVVLGNSLTGEFSRAASLRLRWPFLRRAAVAALAGSGLEGDAVAGVLGRLEDLVKEPFPEPGDETLAGALSNTIAGRICNHFDFHGTGYTVDGACSSSLLAVMTACRALADGDLSMALAGGVDLSLDPFELVGFARVGALARGEMRVYDADPTGFLPGEGCGVVALMRAEEAERRGLRVYAYVTGWGSSSDGAGGLTRPTATGQALAMRRAYRLAGLDPAGIGLVEGHGTGTAVGDRVEIEALTEVIGIGAAPAALGSVKANIGHTKAAAGVAGLIKAALAVHHRVLPPSTGTREPHPLLGRDGVPLRLLAEPEPWDRPVPRAAVSSLGFGGINAHVVLEGPRRTPARSLSASTRRWSAPVPEHHVVVVGATGPAALAERLRRVAGLAPVLSQAELYDLACTSQADSGAAAARAALVAATPDELGRAAEAALTGIDAWDGGLLVDAGRGYALASGPPARVGLMFPGQAAPVRAGLPAWAAGLDVPDSPVALRDGDADTAVAQPAIMRQSLAALAWLDAIGCEPVAAIGHSLGEIAALGWAEALTPGDALRLAAARGEIMARYGTPGTTMASLAAPPETVADLLAGTGAVVAAFNGPAQTVVAGPVADVRAVVERARATGADGVVLAVSHGFHSPAMRPAEAPLRDLLGTIATDAPRRRVISTVTGLPYGDGTPGTPGVPGSVVSPEASEVSGTSGASVVPGPGSSSDASGEASGGGAVEALVAQLTRPVRFAEALARLAGECDLLVEAGPGTILSGLAAHLPVVSLSMDCGGNPRRQAMVTAALAVSGNADLTAWAAGRAYRRLPLDSSPTFLANPCETVAGNGPVAEIPARRPAAPVAGHAPADRTTAVPSADRTSHAGRNGHANGTAGSNGTAGFTGFNGIGGSNGSNGLGGLTGSGATAATGVAGVGATGAGGAPDPLECLRAELAAGLELPLETVRPSSSFLGDLHLNSLQVVRIVSRTAQVLGRQLPAVPLSLAEASVAEAAEVLAGLPSVTEESTEEVEGVGGWVRAFRHEWVPAGPAGAAPVAETGTAVFSLSADDGPEDVAALLTEIAGRAPERLVLRHDGHPAAEAVGRSLAVELPRTSVTVLLAPGPHPGDDGDDGDDGAVNVAEHGYAELRRLPDGSVERRRTVPYPLGAVTGTAPIGEGEVCLVTGGATGITAYSAAALAERTGCVLVLLGRTPAEDPAVAAALADLQARARAVYLRCDVTDPAQVRAALAVAAGHGPVRGLIHGAGVNLPQRLAAVTGETLRAHLRPKVDGLRVLLDEAGDDLSVAVAFGSIIGRRGLAGQSEYCLANDWMRHLVEDWATAHPSCRTHLLEWSVWSGVGMGVRLDTIDALRRQGITAITPKEGADLMLGVLGDAEAPVTLLLTARFPAGPTLAVEGPPAPLLRFTERELTRTPRVEAVYEADLEARTDPYLDDHRISGTRVLPAVVGMEAMAQVATAVGHGATPSGGWSFEDVRLRAPVIVDGDAPHPVRVAALAGPDGTAVVLRDSADAFTTDRFTARLVPAPPVPPAAAAPRGGGPGRASSGRNGSAPGDPGPVPAAHGFYDNGLFFHDGRFRRVASYGLLTAFRVEAVIEAGAGIPEGRWFSSFHSPELLLGDPGTHDATIHALLACVPHREALPVGIDRFTVWRRPSGRCLVRALEREHHAGEYVYDVDLVSAGSAGPAGPAGPGLLDVPGDGEVLARWEGLRLRATGPRAWPAGMPMSLAGPWMSRLLGENGLAQRVELATVPGRREDDAAAGLAALLTGGPVRHDARGALRVPEGGVSASYTGGHVLVGVAGHPLGVDWQDVSGIADGEWPDLVGERGTAVTDALAAKTGEDPGLCAARVWTAREALAKAGAAVDEPLRVHEVGHHGLVTLTAGGWCVATASVPGTAVMVATALPEEV
ncbi:SDR family NAD(P)-dependent oxidoreductase [Streptosporangium sp. NPDC023615]|uniref:SDR family NAD(P)-dependent oxidoreductase n=1 Tax=Streptosporangium sp. NPDC023615 TaxID=3154794 RepID=UPI00341978D4